MILIISSPEDVHAQAVVRELERRGARDVRVLDFGDFPRAMDLSLALGPCAREALTLTFPDGTRVPIADVTAAWWRRPQAFGVPPDVSDATHRQFAMSEAATAFQGLWQASRALWVNDIYRDARASHKSWQLVLAQRLGLAIPETLITNDPRQAQEFWRRHPGQVIYKAFSASTYAWRETRLLRPEEEALAASVRLAPVIFQRYVPARVDLRITVVGERFFAAEAHSQQGEYPVDVRFNTHIDYAPHALPRDVEARLGRLMGELGLEYGAIDMRLTPEGEYVFLEVNPAGQFLYVEAGAGLPIAAALAEHLLRGQATSLRVAA